jgi:hypothetical protein
MIPPDYVKRLAALEAHRGGRHLVVYQDLDDGAVFRDAAGAAYARGSDGRLRDGAGNEPAARLLIVVAYVDAMEDRDGG